MITLINGRGQLGEALKRKVEETFFQENLFIYHTWEIKDKSEQIQKECYEKFIHFVEKNKDQRILFVSTYSQTDNHYNYYKQLSEAFLLSNTERGSVIRLPTLIGKGICENFKEGISKAYGEMELMSLNDAADAIISEARSDSRIRNIRIYGQKISATLARDLILFGANKNENP
jgi:hypothetical protein